MFITSFILCVLIIISETTTSNLIIINLDYTAVYIMTIFKIIFEDNFYYKINILLNASLVHISYRSCWKIYINSFIIQCIGTTNWKPLKELHPLQGFEHALTVRPPWDKRYAFNAQWQYKLIIRTSNSF